MAAEGAVGSAAALAETAESFDAIATVAAADGDIAATQAAIVGGRQTLAERAAVLAKGATARDLHTVLAKTNMAITGAGTVEAGKGAADHIADGAATGYGVERGIGAFTPSAPEAQPAIVISARVFIPILAP